MMVRNKPVIGTVMQDPKNWMTDGSYLPLREENVPPIKPTTVITVRELLRERENAGLPTTTKPISSVVASLRDLVQQQFKENVPPTIPTSGVTTRSRMKREAALTWFAGTQCDDTQPEKRQRKTDRPVKAVTTVFAGTPPSPWSGTGTPYRYFNDPPRSPEKQKQPEAGVEAESVTTEPEPEPERTPEPEPEPEPGQEEEEEDEIIVVD